MAITTIDTEVIVLVIDTVSADTLDTDGTVTGGATSADGWSIVTPTGRDVDYLLKFWDDASGCTIVIKAGDTPPSHRAGLGDLTIAMAASDVRYIMLDKSRFLQDDGTIRITASDAGAEITVFQLPKH